MEIDCIIGELTNHQEVAFRIRPRLTEQIFFKMRDLDREGRDYFILGDGTLLLCNKGKPVTSATIKSINKLLASAVQSLEKEKKIRGEDHHELLEQLSKETGLVVK